MLYRKMWKEGQRDDPAFISGVQQVRPEDTDVWLNPLALVECLFYQLPEAERDKIFSGYLKTIINQPYHMPRCADRHGQFMEHLLENYDLVVTAKKRDKAK